MSAAYRGRLAPSPTGLLHLGHAATFLSAASRAADAQGSLVLRMDDLDPQRSQPAYASAAVEDLHWLGLAWTEAVQQSERLSLYRAALQQLWRKGLVYPCMCSRKDLQQAIEAPHEELGDEPIYSGRCRSLQTEAELSRHDPVWHANLRFRVSDGENISFRDEHFGTQHFVAGCQPGADFGDFVVWRKDGLPSYQLACVVDDAAMGITEVVRGRDLLKSTARQMLLQRALDLPTPRYFHTDLLRDARGERMAKRHDSLSLRTLRASGVTPEEIQSRVADSLHQSKGRGAT